MTILPDIKDGIERARQGKLSLYWQRDIKREYRSKKPTAAEKRAYAELQSVIRRIPQWSSEEELDAEMNKQGGHVLSLLHGTRLDGELTQDCNGAFDVGYVLDAGITPTERKAAAQEVQRLLADRMRQWNMPLMKSRIPEKAKYSYLEEAASHLMQVLNDPESITG